MHKYSHFAFALLLSFLVGAEALAQTNTWLSGPGSNATNWGRNQNWSLNMVPTSAHDVVIPTTPSNGTGFPVLEVNASAKSLTINAGASVTAANGFSLTVSGSVSGAGTLAGGVGTTSTINIGGNMTVGAFTGGASLVVLNGTTPQTINGYTFNEIRMNNAAGVTLAGNVTTVVVYLNAGTLTTGAFKIHTTNGTRNGVQITGGDVNGEVSRLLKTWVPGTGDFKFTDNFTTLILSGAQPEQIASVRSYPGSSPMPVPGTGSAVNRYYVINADSSLIGELRLAYKESELNGIDEGDLTVFRHNGTAWVDMGGVLNMTDNYLEVPGVQFVGNWAIGDAFSPLPIQLMSFTGVVINANTVRLDWATLTETNNYGFEVQKSANSPTSYTTIPNSFVPGHGTTLVPQYYTWTDETASPGRWYYRLKQIDLDGTVHYTEGIEVDVVTSVGEGTVVEEYALGQNYPNPFNPSTVIEYALPQAGYVTVKVYNLLGAEVATLVAGEMPAGRHSIQWNAAGVSSGVYLYKLSAGTFTQTRKLTLMK